MQTNNNKKLANWFGILVIIRPGDDPKNCHFGTSRGGYAGSRL